MMTLEELQGSTTGGGSGIGCKWLGAYTLIHLAVALSHE